MKLNTIPTAVIVMAEALQSCPKVAIKWLLLGLE
jgi:hypothetical protein